MNKMDISEKIKKNFPLKSLTTFRIGGKARYFIEAKNKSELIEGIKWAKQKSLPFFILGGGSNILIEDKRYNGLVIKIKLTEIEVKNSTIKAGAGVSLSKLVGIALREGLAGMEWACGIPGTFGGAIFGNTGSFGASISDSIVEVLALKIGNEKIEEVVLKKSECCFLYRESIFKKNKNLIIVSGTIKLVPGDKAKIQEATENFFKQKKQTQPLEYYSAGSVFKNFSAGNFDWKLAEKFSEIKEFKEKKIIPAGWLIEKAGLKGKRIGQAQFSNKHSNFIVNMGNAKAKHIKKLMAMAEKEIEKKFKLKLEKEIQFVNFD